MSEVKGLKVGDVEFSQAFYDELYSEIWNAPELNAMQSKLSMHHLRGIVKATVRVVQNHKASLIPEGYAIVPIEPTSEMIKPALSWFTAWTYMRAGDKKNAIESAYKTMIEAAPK